MMIDYKVLNKILFWGGLALTIAQVVLDALLQGNFLPDPWKGYALAASALATTLGVRARGTVYKTDVPAIAQAEQRKAVAAEVQAAAVQQIATQQDVATTEVLRNLGVPSNEGK